VTVAGMTFAVPDMEGLAPGTQVSLCIRPADIAVGMVNANRPGGLEAVVETVSFRGNFYRLSVNCRQIGQTLDVEIMRSAWEDRGLASGSKIVVTFPAANLRVFPRRA